MRQCLFVVVCLLFFCSNRRHSQDLTYFELVREYPHSLVSEMASASVFGGFFFSVKFNEAILAALKKRGRYSYLTFHSGTQATVQHRNHGLAGPIRSELELIF